VAAGAKGDAGNERRCWLANGEQRQQQKDGICKQFHGLIFFKNSYGTKSSRANNNNLPNWFFLPNLKIGSRFAQVYLPL
jgi:hypothetical protein